MKAQFLLILHFGYRTFNKTLRILDNLNLLGHFNQEVISGGFKTYHKGMKFSKRNMEKKKEK